MIVLRALTMFLILAAAPVSALSDPGPPVQPATVQPATVQATPAQAPRTRPVARPFGLYLAGIAARLACLDRDSGRRRC